MEHTEVWTEKIPPSLGYNCRGFMAGSYCGARYSIMATWSGCFQTELLSYRDLGSRVKKTKLPWHCIVWFPQAIPRQSFMVWLAFKNNLSTGVIMRETGSEQGCVYCREKDESRDHLFFACPYTLTVRTSVAEKLLDAAITPDWEDTVISLLRSNRIILGSYSTLYFSA